MAILLMKYTKLQELENIENETNRVSILRPSGRVSNLENGIAEI